MKGEEAAEDLLFDDLKLTRRGLFRLDPTGRAVPVALGSRALDLLLLLARREGAVVSKGDLTAGAWPGIAVEDSNLTKQISALRRALDRNPAIGSCIQTVPARGYRFAATVTRVDQAAVAPPLTLPEKPSIAVLPFQNMSGDPGQEYFADGMVEEITTAIARCPGLFVIARNSSYAYKGKSVDVKQVARELGVRYVLEGSVRKAGNRVRIAGQLIDSTTGAHIWADRFDGTLDDVFEFQDRVAGDVVGAIEPRLRRAEAERASRKPTESPDAYDLHLRAQAQAYKRSREGLAESIRLARLALEIDPAYGPAIARIALSRGMQRQRNWIPPAGPEVEEGIAMARQAIAASGDDPWVLDFAGLALAQLAGDNNAALSALDRAIVLNPNFALAFGHRAVVLAYLNRPEEAIPSARQAIRLSPFDPAMFSFYQALALAELAAGRYEAGLSWAEEALRENGGMPALRLKLSLLGYLGRHEEARACLSRVGEFHCEPTIAGIMRASPKGVVPELVARVTEGLRRAGLPA
jgi:adenylate cyclase